jgi:hypothetical protein
MLSCGTTGWRDTHDCEKEEVILCYRMAKKLFAIMKEEVDC